jgi:hypothetical protein
MLGKGHGEIQRGQGFALAWHCTGNQQGIQLACVPKLDALQTRNLTIAPEELKGRSLVSVLREKLARS